MKRPFTTVDVFTDRRFGGNPLAVVTDAAGLSDAEMQAIAAEFNLAETTFVLPPADPAHTARVRIFTPKAELPFAGHPNVGTAYVLARAGNAGGRPLAGDRLLFEEIAGVVPVEVSRRDGAVTAATLAAPQAFAVAEDLPVETVAALAGLAPDDIVTTRHRPLIASCGARFAFAELTSRAALARAACRPDAFARHLPMDRAVGLHLHVAGDLPGLDVQTRMFAPLHGIAEDPATGAANVALVGLLASLRPESDLDFAIAIGQGFDLGRPSRLEAAATKRGGIVTATFIGGSCVPMLQGTIDLG